MHPFALTLDEEQLEYWLEELELAKGGHPGPDAGMCVMEAIAWLAGEEFSDHPQCVSPAIGAFARSWNDALPDADRQRLLKPLMVGMIGTRTDDADVESRLAWMATDWIVRVHAPAWLRLAGLTEQAETVSGMAELTPDTAPSFTPVLQSVRSDAAAAFDAAGVAAWDAAGDAAWAAAGDAARVAAWDAAWATAWVAAWDAAWAAGAAGDVARVAAWAAAWAAGDAAGDALAPTVTELQTSAADLLARMCAEAKAAA